MAAADRTALVIGAGLGGLAVAARLAHRGWRVTVVERDASPGGKMNQWRTGGFRFDTGPSLVTMPWVFEELFRDIGLRMADHVELMKVEPAAEYVFDDGGRFTHSARLPDMLDEIRRWEGGSADGVLSFLRLGMRLYELSKGTFFARSPFEPGGPPPTEALRHLPLRHAWGRYADTVERFVRSPHLRRVFLRYATYVGSSPWRMPATLAVIPAIESAFGVWHARGGLYSIIEALVSDLARRGVELRTGAHVETIERESGRVRGARLSDGTRLDARAVIFNGDAGRLPALLGEPGARPPPESRRSTSGMVFLIATPRTLPDQPHHRVFFSADYPEEFRDLFERRVFPRDPTVYVNMPSRTDRSMTPGSGEVVFIMANAPANDGDAWDASAIAEAEQRVFARLTRSGFPDLREGALSRRVITPRDLAGRFDMPGGSIYGAASHGWRGAFLRAPNRVRRHPGLFCVGGSTHPGGGTPTVLLSSRITADLVERHA
ncbi:MAG: phytoene desaturase [Kiritimatiellae bacterium]|nr:phytoene desaturase [Kiritimatiellia bacterium]